MPSIDGVAFIDPRRSTIDIIQALGRAIRKSPDKKVGTIVMPVFLSDEEDPEQVLDESAFKHVWDVLKALRAHDEALGEELDEPSPSPRRSAITTLGGQGRSSWMFRRSVSALGSSRPSMLALSSRPQRRGSSGSGCYRDSLNARATRESRDVITRTVTTSISG